jgi:hypothetical protein
MLSAVKECVAISQHSHRYWVSLGLVKYNVGARLPNNDGGGGGSRSHLFPRLAGLGMRLNNRQILGAEQKQTGDAVAN